MVFALAEAMAQIELSNFTATGRAGLSTALATDYQAQGINPANLAAEPLHEGLRYTFGMAELGFSAYSDALSRFNLRSALFDSDRQLSQAEKNQAAFDFANRGLTLNLDFLYAGFASQKQEGGSGYAFTIRERAQWYSKFNPVASDILFRGFQADYFDPNRLITEQIVDTSNGVVRIDTLGALAKIPKSLSEILSGTKIAMAWNREYAFSYGVNVLKTYDLKWDIGLGVKYIQGIGYLDIQSDGKNMTAFISSSPWFNVQFGNSSQLNTAIDTLNAGFLPNATGRGLGFEFGTTVILKDKFRFSASVTDLGRVNYQTNVYTASDTLLTDIRNRGFTSYNFFRNADQFDGFQKDMIKWQGLRNRLQALPSRLRLGFAYVAEKWVVGIESVIPLNQASGNFERAVFSVGGEYKVGHWLRVGSGFLAGGNYRNVLIPFGITFVTSGGLWEMGVASRDVTTFVKQRNPMISLSTGFLRFRF